MTPSCSISCVRCTRLFTSYEWDQSLETSDLCVGCLMGTTFFNLDVAAVRAARNRADAVELARRIDAMPEDSPDLPG